MKRFEIGRAEFRKRNRLPHLVGGCGTYFLTWNLKDAIPGTAKQELRHELEFELRRVRMMRRTVTPADRAAAGAAVRRRIEVLLDTHEGECLLKDPRCASTVADSLEFFNHVRYELSAWCVMPNHVHVVVSLDESQKIDAVVGAWKGYTSKMINRMLGRSGPVWQEDYYDRTIRHERQFRNTLAYVVNNPSSAGMMAWEFVRSYSGQIERVLA